MSALLEIVINEPFQAELIRHLYDEKDDLEKAHPGASFPFCEKEWESILKKDELNTSIVLKMNQIIIGHLAFILNGESLYICFITISKLYRGQKHAKQMITQSEEFCRLNYSHSELFLNVDSENKIAIELYKSLGYQTTHQHKKKITMKKDLRKLKTP